MSIYALVSDIPEQPQVELFAIKPEEPKHREPGSALVKYIPTEIIAPYAAALSLAPEQGWDPVQVYMYAILVTPLAVALFAMATQVRKKKWPSKGPLAWRAIAATVAFAVWALVIPNNPFQAQVGGPGVSAFAAMVISPILDAADTIIMNFLED